jgi:regulator of sigma E protease
MILTAGVTMNFLLGVVLFAVVYSFVGIPVKTQQVRIVELAADSPAEQAGLMVDEIVTAVRFSGEVFNITETNQLVKLVNEKAGEEIVLTIVRKDGSQKQVRVIPRKDPPEGQGALGVVLSNVVLTHFPFWQMPFRGAVVGVSEAIAWGGDIASGLWQMVYGLLTGKGVPKDLAGPVGIYQVSGKVIKEGILATLQFIGVLSVNLAVLNILPFPALDGGRLVFLGVEKIIGKKKKNRIEGYVNTVGMVMLLSLMLLITIRDLLRLFNVL